MPETCRTRLPIRRQLGTTQWLRPSSHQWPWTRRRWPRQGPCVRPRWLRPPTRRRQPLERRRWPPVRRRQPPEGDGAQRWPWEHLLVACKRARYFVWGTCRQLEAIEAILKGTNEASPDVLEDLVAKVAMAERLWEASACLATRHLLGILGDICRLLVKPPGGSGGPSGRTVAEQCQKAIADILRLLQGQ
ncbi:uncharacterized protein LOC128801794 isoform X1 [Vidua chalybeata]|uniref:uncharacterized protein LOC128801794 isoform X1 n=1 Tax=Vidua chalybeata TaxID=81927 RepID=UPI0023A7C0B9|nr:uncharacterized protein LOC128801794 isoform X1 [Vidua chalybeata]